MLFISLENIHFFSFLEYYQRVLVRQPQIQILVRQAPRYTKLFKLIICLRLEAYW